MAEKMIMIVGIKFRDTGKTYYFSPKDIKFREGEGVICETARGVEYGKVCQPNREVSESEIVSPLKEVQRKATPEDEKRQAENLEKRKDIIKTATQKVADRNLEMKIVDAEYTFDRQKIIIYFTAAGRIDFRELVKDLASAFHVRIELRQIYERDEIKLQGALAACGRPCCCTTYLHDFDKVTIKMAKIQGLSLNPQKISGCCGKLMCCLKYENDYYQKTYSEMPKVGSMARTPDGEGQVTANDILRREVTVKITTADGGIEVKTYPLDRIIAKVKQNEKEIPDEDK